MYWKLLNPDRTCAPFPRTRHEILPAMVVDPETGEITRCAARVSCWESRSDVFDKWTVIFLDEATMGQRDRALKCMFLDMSDHPMHPQGLGQYGECDPTTAASGWGNKGWGGKRIGFKDLPPDCRRLVLHELNGFAAEESKRIKLKLKETRDGN